jgi:hypothetical protein
MLDARDLLGSQTLHGFVCEHGRGAQIRQVIGDDDAVACAPVLKNGGHLLLVPARKQQH